MTVSLGGVVLNESLTLRGLFESPQVAITVERTLSGDPAPMVFPIVGRTLTLTTTWREGKYSGYYTRAQLQSLAAIRDSGQAVALVYRGATYNVLILADGINVSQLTGTPTVQATDWYAGDINMIEV